MFFLVSCLVFNKFKKYTVQYYSIHNRPVRKQNTFPLRKWVGISRWDCRSHQTYFQQTWSCRTFHESGEMRFFLTYQIWLMGPFIESLHFWISHRGVIDSCLEGHTWRPDQKILQWQNHTRKEQKHGQKPRLTSTKNHQAYKGQNRLLDKRMRTCSCNWSIASEIRSWCGFLGG